MFSKCKSVRVRSYRGEGWAWNIFLSLFTFCEDCLHPTESALPIYHQGIYLPLKTTEPATRETLLQLVLGLRSEHMVGRVSLLAKSQWISY